LHVIIICVLGPLEGKEFASFHPNPKFQHRIPTMIFR